MNKKKPRWIDELHAPCDLEIFMGALAAYNRGADTPLPPRSGPGLYLTDRPENRAGIAGVKFLRDAGVGNPQAYLWRIMHFGEILRAADEYGLGEHVRVDEVSGALIRAAAVANINFPSDTSSVVAIFDMVDVAARAAEFRIAEEAGEGKPTA